MQGKHWLALLCLVAGIALASWGLAERAMLVALAGLALVFVFLYFAMQWMAKAGKPDVVIKPAANAAWSMKDQPVQGAAQAGERKPAPDDGK
jgi:hypothetical protein